MLFSDSGVCMIDDTLFSIINTVTALNTMFSLNRDCRNGNKDSKKHKGIVPESLEAIDSILSMDDTILKNLEGGNAEGDEDETYTLTPHIHEKTLSNFGDEWSICDTFEIHQNCKNEHTKCTGSTVTNNISKGANTYWQDDTLLNEALTQLDSAIIKDVSEKSSQDIAKDSIKCQKQILFTVSDTETHIKQQAAIPLKRTLDNSRITISKKIFCPRDKTNEHMNSSGNNNTFYGLPNKVKELFKKVRDISTLYQWQDECLSLDAVKNRKNLIYALPTSGGKTLVAEILMLKELLCKKRNAIFILPFVAIVQEKIQAMAPFALELDFMLEEYAASKGTYPPKKRRKKNSMYVCTIEKALGLINSLIEENRFHEIGIIVVDELHLLGESGGRGASLEVLLTKALYVNENLHIIGMSATIGNLDEIAQFLKADLYTGNFRPIAIKEYVKCDGNIWLLNSETEELLTDVKKVNYRYSSDAAIIDPDRIGGLVMDVVPGDSCLIFCSSRKNCENVALLLTKILFKSLENCKQNEKQNLLNALKNEEGLCPILQKTIKFGVAYHHSGLTSEERRLLEDAFRAGTLCVICCTSTLAAGVNLPARRVILRSPYVGNQFLNLSRYKQMIGRAGRAGMGNVGESIIICKNDELPKVKELLNSKMDDSVSTIHIEKDRGINHLILSSVLLSIATTRSEIHRIVKMSLLNVQQNRLNVNVKEVVDDALTQFLKSGVMKVKEERKSDELKPNVSVVFPSQDIFFDNISAETKRKKIVELTSNTKLELCNLGRAAMKGCIDMQTAYTLYQDLKTAQEHLILVDYLHLLYLVTPYDITAQIKPVGSVYYDVVTRLSETQMKTARLIGINEVNVHKIRNGVVPKNVEARVINRFYVTLILHDLWMQHAVYSIAEKYHVSRGVVQNLLTAVASFASSVVRFCQELDEFWAFNHLLDMLGKKLSYCCPMELEILMDLPFVKIGRARQLFNAGFRTIQGIAKAKPVDLQEKIPYLSKKVATQIIEAAKLLILKKIEDLRDETEDVLDGININLLKET